MTQDKGKIWKIIKVRITQHLIHSEHEFVQELTKSGFVLPSEYFFDKFYDEEDCEDGSILEFDLNEKDIDTLISSAKKVCVDYIQIDKLDELREVEEFIYPVI